MIQGRKAQLYHGPNIRPAEHYPAEKTIAPSRHEILLFLRMRSIHRTIDLLMLAMEQTLIVWVRKSVRMDSPASRFEMSVDRTTRIYFVLFATRDQYMPSAIL